MLIVANSAVAAVVLILPIPVRRECYDIAGDDFECSKGLANVCRSDDLQAATHACEKLGQCVAVVGSKPSYTLKTRHTPVLGSSCQQIVEDVHTTMRCRISHARRWSQNRCRGSKPWVADREDFRHLSLGSGANNSTFDGDTTMRDDPTLHRALRCEALGISSDLIDLPEWKPTMDRLRSECTSAVFEHHPLYLSLAPRPRSAAAVDLVILVHYSPARNRRCFATEQVRAMGLSTDFPRLVVTTHMDKDRAPLRLFEKCIDGDFCELGREHDSELSAFAVHTAFQWAFEVGRRSGAERVLFLEDDVIVREPQLVQAHIAAFVERIEAADPAWLALFMCSRGANEPDLLQQLQARGAKPNMGNIPIPCSRAFVLSARGLNAVANATSPTASPVDFAMPRLGAGEGRGSYYLHPGLFEEGSQGAIAHVPTLAGSTSVWQRLSDRRPKAKASAIGVGGANKRVPRGEDLFEGACSLTKHATAGAAPLRKRARPRLPAPGGGADAPAIRPKLAAASKPKASSMRRQPRRGGESSPRAFKQDAARSCAADHGTSVMGAVCCGQLGTVSYAAAICPADQPQCIDFSANARMGYCQPRERQLRTYGRPTKKATRWPDRPEEPRRGLWKVPTVGAPFQFVPADTAALAALPPGGGELGRMHGQVGQDRMLLKLLSGLRHGVFVDLAANEPVLHSNTRSLERDYGWEGLCVEVNPQYHLVLQAYRNCTLIGAAVADAAAALPFKTQGAGFGSIGGKLGDKGVMAVMAVPFPMLLETFHLPPRIDFLSLDVEGAEEKVMSSFPFERVVVSVLTVERPVGRLVRQLKKHRYRYLCDCGLFGDELYVHASTPIPPSIRLGSCASWTFSRPGKYHCEPNFYLEAEGSKWMCPSGGGSQALQWTSTPPTLIDPRHQAGDHDSDPPPPSSTLGAGGGDGGGGASGVGGNQRGGLHRLSRARSAGRSSTSQQLSRTRSFQPRAWSSSGANATLHSSGGQRQDLVVV